MTLSEALRYGKEQLSASGIQEANIDAWYLLEYVTRVSRAEYFGDTEKIMTEQELDYYIETVERRKNRVPLQHITGVQEFMGHVFQVNEDVLIPRQDTEVLVECTYDVIEQEMQILDLCTGSGCIAISLKKMCDSIEVTGADISRKALDVAIRNGMLNQVECTWVNSDLFASIDGEFDIIVSNPPYIRTSVIEELEEEVKLHDPMIALDGKEDGLYFYYKIIEQSVKYLKSQGVLLFEIGHDQGEAVSEYMMQHGFTDVVVKKDLAGLDRVVFGRVE